MFFKKKYQLVKNKTLKEYNEKYKEYFEKHPEAKKEVKVLTLDDIAENKKILNKHGWWLIGDKLYQIPDAIYKRNALLKKYAKKGVKKIGKKARKAGLASMGVTTKVVIASVVGVAVAAGITVPIVVVNVVNKKEQTITLKGKVAVEEGSSASIENTDVNFKEDGDGNYAAVIKSKEVNKFLRVTKVKMGNKELVDDIEYSEYHFDSYNNTLTIFSWVIEDHENYPKGDIEVTVSDAILAKSVNIGLGGNWESLKSVYVGTSTEYWRDLESVAGEGIDPTITNVRWSIVPGYEEYAEIKIDQGGDINDMCRLIAKKEGDALVKVETIDGTNLSTTAKIVIKPTTHVSDIKIIGPDYVSFKNEEESKIKYKVSVNSDASVGGAYWEVNDIDYEVAGIDYQEGILSPRKEGEVTIYATSRDGKKKVSKTIQVRNAVGTDFKIHSEAGSGKEHWMDITESTRQFYTEAVENGIRVPVKWSVLDTNLATINEDTGVLTLTEEGKKQGGKVIVTARSAKSGENIQSLFELNIGSVKACSIFDDGKIGLNPESATQEFDTFILPTSSSHVETLPYGDADSFYYEIGGGAFENLKCQKLIISNPDLRDINGGSFYNSTLKELVFPYNSEIRGIQDGAFCCCKDLKTVNFDVLMNLNFIGSKAFCSEYEEEDGTLVLVAGNLESNGETRFKFHSVEQIQGYAFAEQPKIKEISLPRTLSYIGQKAFYVNDNTEGGLTTIYYNGTKDEWNKIDTEDSWYNINKGVTIKCQDGNIENPDPIHHP